MGRSSKRTKLYRRGIRRNKTWNGINGENNTSKKKINKWWWIYWYALDEEEKAVGNPNTKYLSNEEVFGK